MALKMLWEVFMTTSLRTIKRHTRTRDIMSGAGLLVFILCIGVAAPSAAGFTLGPRFEVTHPGTGHEVHLSGAAVAAVKDGSVFIAWIAAQGEARHVYVARPGVAGGQAVRVNPEGLIADSLHQPPGLAVGPGGEIYVSWASVKPKPEGTLFASDLRLSRSLDGGQSFEPPLRVNEDRPISHSFEGLAVAADGTVVVVWIDSRDGWEQAGTYLARVGKRGSVVEQIVQLDGDTCVCCRVHVATAPKETVAVTWRKVFPENIRDMVFALSRDGGRVFAPTVRVHADGWRIAACPHRGGSVGMDGQGRFYVTWYTEGAQEQPSVLFAVSDDGRHFTAPTRLDTSTTSIPDHVRMAVDTTKRAAVVWEDATAVRRRVLLRYTTDGGETISPSHTLSQAIRAYAPDVAVSPTGAFMVIWHEEQFPAIKTVVQPVWLDEKR
jgi:hypothetical protein